jgi:hypothetical protein
VKFQGRDWKTIRLGEIVEPNQVRFVEYDTSVEDATSVSTSIAPGPNSKLTQIDLGRIWRPKRGPTSR